MAVAQAVDVTAFEILTGSPNGYTNARNRGSSGKCRLMGHTRLLITCFAIVSVTASLLLPVAVGAQSDEEQRRYDEWRKREKAKQEGAPTTAPVIETQSSATASTYAALAVVPGKGRMFHGYAKRGSAKEARKAALRKCSKSDCIVVQEYLSGRCAHFVLGDDQSYWNLRGFTPQRKQDVIAHCNRIDENCQVIVSDCLP